ncbi:MAG: DUF4149 domain-containing protein [Gammaproteobacteria bacterium]
MILQSILLWLLGGLVGGMLFFALAVAPTVFRALPAEHAGAFLRAMFPRYYFWGLVAAILATMLALFARADSAVTIACAIVTLMFVYARQQLMPAINRARDARLGGDEDAAGRFRRLHGLSVFVNLAQLLLLIAATARLIWV